MSWNTTIKWVVQLTIMTIIVVFVGVYLRDQLVQLSQNPVDINWHIIVISQVTLTLGLALLPLGAMLILRSMKVQLPAIIVWRIYFLSNIAKYLPGSVWALPGRSFLYQQNGVSIKKSAVAVLWEIGLLLVGSTVVALFGLPIIASYIDPLIVLIIGMVALILVGLLFFLWQTSRLHIPARIANQINQPDLGLSAVQILWAVLANILTWVVIGTSFSGIVYAVYPDLSLTQSIEAIGLYSGTWIVGFLVIFTPGGIGVRDVLIILGLALFLNEPLPTVIAIIARITWTFGEITNVLMFSLLYYSVKRS